MFKTKYIAKKELMDGEWFWFIYAKFLWWEIFVQRCNTEASCKARLQELRNPSVIDTDL